MVTASEFCEWADVDFDVCIPHRNYQFKLHSSSSFLAFYVASIVHVSHFSPLYHQSKFSRSKFKHRETSKRWKRVLDLLNLRMLIKEERVSPRRKFLLATFGKLLIKFSGNLNVLYVIRYFLLHLMRRSWNLFYEL